jgi:hypothetical protein
VGKGVIVPYLTRPSTPYAAELALLCAQQHSEPPLLNRSRLRRYFASSRTRRWRMLAWSLSMAGAGAVLAFRQLLQP